MNSGFLRRGDFIYRAFADEEVRVLKGLVHGLDQTLEGDDPNDPVLRRMAPAAYGPEEGDFADEFAGFTHTRIVAGKRERLAAFADGLSADGITELDLAAAQIWLMALNDLRLALAERIGTDGLDSQNGTSGEVYDWLGWLQSGLVEVVTAD